MISEVRITPHKLVILIDQEARLPETKEAVTIISKPVVQYECASDSKTILINVPIRYLRYNDKVKIEGIYEIKKANAHLVNALACGWHERQLLRQGMEMGEIGKAIRQSKKVVQGKLLLTYLSPRIIEAILKGDHPESLNVSMLYSFAHKPRSYEDQEKAFEELCLQLQA